jgi:hypothetical protein
METTHPSKWKPHGFASLLSPSHPHTTGLEFCGILTEAGVASGYSILDYAPRIGVNQANYMI